MKKIILSLLLAIMPLLFMSASPAQAQTNCGPGAGFGGFCFGLPSFPAPSYKFPIGNWGWSQCSNTCGVGTQTRTATCSNWLGFPSAACTGPAPTESQACTGTSGCAVYTGSWNRSSAPSCPTACGQGASTQTGSVTCSTGNASDCDPSAEPAPLTNNCSATSACSPTYPGSWSAAGAPSCPTACGQSASTQTGAVTCSTGNVSDCDPAARPAARTRGCSATSACISAPTPPTPPTPPAFTGAWNTTPAPSCPTACGQGASTQTGTVTCSTGNASDCDPSIEPPAPTNSCAATAACAAIFTGTWNTTAAPACNTTCGQPASTESGTVTCSTGTESDCDPSLQPAVDTNNCPSTAACAAAATTGDWTVGSWGNCSAACAGGTQYRSVTCLFDSCNGVAPDTSQACNTGACPAAARAGNVGVVAAGVDWENSRVTITDFDPQHPSHLTNFECFGSTSLPVDITLDQMSLVNADPGPEREQGALVGSTCFQQAGDYDLDIILTDLAGNTGVSQSYTLTVLAAEAGSLQTTLEPVAYTKDTKDPSLTPIDGSTNDCTAERLLANSGDDCTLRLTLRDDFGNVVALPSSPGRLSIAGRNANNTNLDLVSDAEGAFIDGLRLNDSVNTLAFTTDSDGQFEFDISALAPSIETVASVSDPAFKLAQVISRPATIQFPVPQVSDSGSLSSGTPTPIAKSIDLQFEPWVKLFISDNAPVSGSSTAPSEPLYFLQAERKPLYAFSSTLLDHFLPSNFEIFIKGFTRPVGLSFEEEDLTNGATDLDGDSVPEGYRVAINTNARSQTEDFTTRIKSSNGLFGDENMAIGSKIRHAFTEAGLVKRVLYPGGNLGSSVGPEPSFPTLTIPDPSVPGAQPGTATALLIGADIEGKVLANSDIRLVDTESTKLVNLGGVSSQDVREDILRNATVLTRGKDPIPSSGGTANFGLGSFTDDVAYFENVTVTLSGGQFSDGAKTIIIKDGNLFIPDDITYAGVNDSLGVILINTDPEAQETGNVFVGNTVQRLVGSYYADGAFLSTTANAGSVPSYTDVIADRSLTNVDSPSAPLGLQLLLEGTLLTRNTLGGALVEPPRGPWGDTTQEEAITYDLHFMRRYVPPVDPATLTLLTDDQNNACVKVSGVCDVNRHSLVIRADGRVRTLTPPGFEETPGFSAQ